MIPNWRLVLRVVLLSTIASTARAADFPVDFAGSRSLAMGGAHRGMGNSNDALYLNPAGMAQGHRYGLEGQYLYIGGSHLNMLVGSAVDSKSGPVAGGVGYSRIWGNPTGIDAELNRMVAGAAYALGPAVSLGATGNYVKGSFRDGAHHRDVDAINGTLGLSLRLGEMIGFGLSYQNMVGQREPMLQPAVLGAGLALNLSRLTLATDLTRAMRSEVERAWAYQLGGEFLVGEMMAVRAGYQNIAADLGRAGPPRHFVGGGIGLVAAGSAINISYEQRLGEGSLWRMTAGMVFYL